MSFKDYATAAYMRDVVSGLVRKLLDTERPAPRYATVQSIDRAQRRCMVRFPAEDDDVSVSMGAVQPMSAGQVVRIEGVMGNRYIADVMGPASVAGVVEPGTLGSTIAATEPAGWLFLDGQSIVDGQTLYPDLWGVAPAGWKSGSTLNLPNWAGRTLIGAGAGAGLTVRALGATGGVEDVTLSAAQIPSHTHSNGTLTAASAGAHTHSLAAANDIAFIVANNGGGSGILASNGSGVVQRTRSVSSTSSDGAHTHNVTGTTSAAGSGNSHENMQPWAAANIIIKT